MLNIWPLKSTSISNPWTDWEDQGARLRHHDTLEHYRHLLADRIDYHRITQYLFFSQWKALKAYANAKGIEIVGDMPIYIAADSADMWANPHFFKIDDEGKPSVVAGCPPYQIKFCVNAFHFALFLVY